MLSAGLGVMEQRVGKRETDIGVEREEREEKESGIGLKEKLR